MGNAKQEILAHIKDRRVTQVLIVCEDVEVFVKGTLEEVLLKLDFEYDDGYGGQELFGYIWYDDETWSDREEYDGSEWWEYRECPDINTDIEDWGKQPGWIKREWV